MTYRQIPRSAIARLRRGVVGEQEKLLGERAVRQKLISAEQLDAAILELETASDTKNMQALLVDRGWATPNDIAFLVEEARREELARLAIAVNPGMPQEVRERLQDKFSHLGEFILVARIGKGGAGEVWKAWDRGLSRWVAIKIPKIAPESRTALTRFQQEGLAAARLEHSGIVPIYRVDEHNGQPFIVMRLVDGHTLGTTTTDVKTAARLIRSAAEAVGYAHRQGVVHRDIKPGNIMVDSRETVVLLDFGLAHLQENRRTLTVQGSVLGTPAYMSPEQARAEPAAKNPATDIYSLGATLYELVTGRTPFIGDNFVQLVTQVSFNDPPTPRSLNPRIPRDLETIILKAMDKSPARRYATAEALAGDLGRFLDGDPIEARPQSTIERIWRRGMKYRGVVLPTAILGVVVLSIAVSSLWRNRTQAEQVERWMIRARDLEREGNYQDAHSHYQKALTLNPNARNAPFARKGLERMEIALKAIRDKAARADVEREAMRLLEAGRPAIDAAHGYLYSRNANFEDLVRQVEQGQKLIDRALEIAPKLAAAHYQMGRAWEIRGFRDRAEASYRRAVEENDQMAIAHFHLGRLILSNVIEDSLMASEANRRRSEKDYAVVAAEGAKELERAFEGEGAFEFPLQRKLAEAMLGYFRGNHKAAVKIVQETVRDNAGRQGVEEFHVLNAIISRGDERMSEFAKALDLRPQFPLALLCRGAVRRIAGDYPAALADFNAVLRINPRMVKALINRAVTRDLMNDFEPAIQDYTTLIEINPPDAGEYLHERGMLKVKRKDLAGAMADQRQAIALRPEDASCVLELGTVLFKSGDLPGAQREFVKAIEMRPDYADAYTNRGICRCKAGDHKGGIEDFERALALQPNQYKVWVNRGVASHALKDYARAVESYEKALECMPEGAFDRESVVKAIEINRDQLKKP